MIENELTHHEQQHEAKFLSTSNTRFLGRIFLTDVCTKLFKFRQCWAIIPCSSVLNRQKFSISSNCNYSIPYDSIGVEIGWIVVDSDLNERRKRKTHTHILQFQFCDWFTCMDWLKLELRSVRTVLVEKVYWRDYYRKHEVMVDNQVWDVYDVCCTVCF